MIVEQHMQSSAMWSIFLLQDLLNIRTERRCADAADEQINHPENPNQYWQYRMPLTLEELTGWTNFNQELKALLQRNGR
jgi:4-alpha-glucanotransferase